MITRRFTCQDIYWHVDCSGAKRQVMFYTPAKTKATPPEQLVLRPDTDESFSFVIGQDYTITIDVAPAQPDLKIAGGDSEQAADVPPPTAEATGGTITQPKD